MAEILFHEMRPQRESVFPALPARLSTVDYFVRKLVSDGLRVPDYAVGRLGSIRPEMVDNAVCLRSNRSNFLGLGLWHIEYLHATCGNFDLVVMIVPVPGLKRGPGAGHGLGDEILDIRQGGVGIGRIQTSKHWRISVEIPLQ